MTMEMEDIRAKKRASRQEKELRNKKRKQDFALTEGAEWDRCLFKIVRKNRFCNLERVTGSQFCGNHLPDSENIASKKSEKFEASLRRRVPCPVDDSHTVYEYDLARHVLVCNKVKDASVMAQLPYYTENINSGTHCVVDTKAETQEVDTSELKTGDAGDAAHATLSPYEEQGLVDRLQSIDFNDLVRRINAAYDKCVSAIPLEKLSHPCCDQLFAEKTAAGSSKNVLRHIEQQASILGHMDRVGLLQPNATFIELGAGRGMLSLALVQHLKDSAFVLIDRAHTRGKADHFIGKDAATIMRAKIDIRHLNFAGMRELENRPLVCMSKHLCGVATDLSLRAIASTLPTQPECGLVTSDLLSSHFEGLAVALCCHHVCSWKDYVNPEFFLAQGFQASEFALVASMTSWGTCGMSLGGDVVEYLLGISQSDRALLGRKCKRVLDAGRVAYLRDLQLQTQLVHYCDVQDSLENCLLLAWK